MQKSSSTTGFLVITLSVLIFIFALYKYLSQNFLGRIRVHNDLTFKAALTKEFRLLNSTLFDVYTPDERTLRNASCVLIATSQPRYRYTRQWIQNHRATGIPYIHYTTGLLKRKLAPHYGRIFALIATIKTLPNMRTFVYTDIDTAVDFEKACKLNSHPITISWKLPAGEPYDVVLRTNWFVFNPYVNLSSNGNSTLFTPMRLLNTWLQHARRARWHDQTILNELYRDEKWVRANIALYNPNKATKGIEIAHCGSYMSSKQRDACMHML